MSKTKSELEAEIAALEGEVVRLNAVNAALAAKLDDELAGKLGAAEGVEGRPLGVGGADPIVGPVLHRCGQVIEGSFFEGAGCPKCGQRVVAADVSAPAGAPASAGFDLKPES